MARDDYNFDFDFDKTVIPYGKDFYLILKNIAHKVGVGYEEIWDNISSDCKTITLGEVVDIAEKVKKERDEPEENPEMDSAVEKMFKRMSESFRNEGEDKLPF